MTDLIKRNLQGKKVLLLFIVTNIVYVFMLTITIPAVMSYSNGMKILDMMPLGYDATYVNTLFETLGSAGREVYLFRQLPMDLLYPFLFGVSSCLVLAYFLTKLGMAETPLFHLCVIPLFSGLFDYAENIGIITLLNHYPDHSTLMIRITSFFSILKSSFTILYFISLIIAVIVFSKNRLFAKTI